ncbi:MAG: hypothetical protein WCY27_02900 [archaeon]|jgi:hypothetical protein|nr:hypothetical protein [archaeon]MDD2477509.1 hypothetical protein [Candidatus ainarchaeum sp.]MDD3084808.1 hypothetical protein [Candidatus ainarchaeum sp.]MDD4221372.1 hypothetical protein [Candidatus ainarchaeum sp.]MDD4662388.1 hypothetical protein [Candidatus ainarchaeum sp.]
MNKNIKIISSILVLLSFVLTLGFVSAYRGNVNQAGPNYDIEVHDSIQVAIESKDYLTWYRLMSEKGNSKITSVITEDIFSEFSSAYLEAVSGNVEALVEFRESVGLGQKNQFRKNNLEGKRFRNNQDSSMNNGSFQKRGLNNSNCNCFN